MDLRLRKASFDLWWWPGNKFGEAAQILSDGCEGELILRATGTAQTEATKLQNTLEMGKQHFDAFSIVPRALEALGAGQ